MIEEGVIKPLLRLSESEDAEVRREVARAFALFASKKDSHGPLTKAHAPSKIMTFLSDKDEVVIRYGVLGIGNMAVSRECHQELFDVGAIAKVLPCANSTDALTKRAVAFTFNNFSANPANHSACERLGVIRYITALLKDVDKDTNLQACLAVRHLFESARCRNQFLEMQG
jgi:hypothetical protein